VEIADFFLSCHVYNTTTQQYEVLDKTTCKFGYRDSIFKQLPGRYIIIDVTFQLAKVPNPILTYKPVVEYIQKYFA
jgi:UDP-N-acetylmuramate dehydrogenase